MRYVWRMLCRVKPFFCRGHAFGGGAFAYAGAKVDFARLFAGFLRLYSLQCAGTPSKLSDRPEAYRQKPPDVDGADRFVFTFDSDGYGVAAGCTVGTALSMCGGADGYAGFCIYGNSKGTEKGGA